MSNKLYFSKISNPEESPDSLELMNEYARIRSALHIAVEALKEIQRNGLIAQGRAVGKLSRHPPSYCENALEALRKIQELVGQKDD